MVEGDGSERGVQAGQRSIDLNARTAQRQKRRKRSLNVLHRLAGWLSR